MFHSKLFLLSTSLTLIFGGSSIADTIKLKDGTTKEGTIVAEDDASVTIAHEVQRGIKEDIKIDKSTIASIQKEDPSTAAWNEFSRDINPESLATIEDHDQALAKIDAFISSKPDLQLSKVAKNLIATLMTNKARLEKGDVKINGQWIPADEYNKQKYWYDGSIALNKMEQLAKSGALVESMRAFESLEETHSGSSYHAQAITLAQQILKRYSSGVQEAIVLQPSLIEKRSASIKTLAPENRSAVERRIKEEAEALKAKVALEKDLGTKWFTLNPLDKSDLTKTQKIITTELKRISDIDASQFAANDEYLKKIEAALAANNPAEASKLISEASDSLKKSPRIKELDATAKADAARIKSEASAKAAAIKAEEAAIKEAEKAAKDALKAGKNPPKPTPPVTAPPTSSVTPPAASIPAAQKPEVKPEPAIVATATPEPKKVAPLGDEKPKSALSENPNPSTPAEKKTAEDTSTDLLLKGVAGTIGLAIVALLVFPMFKKKPVEVAVADHHKQNDPASEAEEITRPK